MLAVAALADAQGAANRYALILEDAPVAKEFSRGRIAAGEAGNYRSSVEEKQRSLRDELGRRNIRVSGSASTVMNAIFVASAPARLDELRALPGVVGVLPVRKYKRKLNRALTLVNAQGAWNTLPGGFEQAGLGVKIGILDTGIDQNHAAFQDASLSMPAGFPKCNGADCAFTNNKVIVARSYVRQLGAGSDPLNPAADSRPDDFSPRDHSGHGTAVASAAAGYHNAGLVAISGVAPKAYLGNYKIYGSPEINDFTSDDVIILALDDAVNDGMDIVSFSSGGPAFTGPTDSGASCGNPTGVACDLAAQAFENAAEAGLVIVSAGGNEGDLANPLTFNSIDSPGDAPSVISVGATTNSHEFAETVNVPGVAALQNIATNTGDAFVAPGVTRGPLSDVAMWGGGTLGCNALPFEAMVGQIALIQRGSCTFETKAQNAIGAGAVGVIFYMADSSPPFSFSGMSNFSVPGVMISLADGQNLRSFIDSHPYSLVDIDPHGIELSASNSNLVASFSSLGPAADGTLKPDLVAVGGNENVTGTGSVYLATQKYDPLGDMYSADGYANADGTSFATPLVSGAAALVKQQHPQFTAAEIKSALVNTATTDVTADDAGNTADVRWLGAGKLSAANAVATTVTSTPSTISFGVIRAGVLPVARQLTIANFGTGTVNFSLANAPAVNSTASIAINPSSVAVPAGGSHVVTVTLSGSLPAAGVYSGAITVQGGPIALRIPYLYISPNGASSDMIPLSGAGFDGTVGSGIPDGVMAFKLVDTYGVPIANTPVSWSAQGGGSLAATDTRTNTYGVATAQPILGSTPGNYSFTGSAGGLSYTFSGTARAQPIFLSNQVVDAASFQRALAPGSYITIFGSGLSDSTASAASVVLPVALQFVSVSFDVPSANLSIPGRLLYVSPSQINVQVPWELAGQISVQMKVTVDFSTSNVVTVPLAPVSPGLFEIFGYAGAIHSDFSLVNANSPAAPGEMVQLFANGLGPVTNQPATGDPAPSSPLAQTATLPVVTIGGQQAMVTLSALLPGSSAVYALNIVIPPSLAPGTYPTTVSIGGQTSQALNIVVRGSNGSAVCLNLPNCSLLLSAASNKTTSAVTDIVRQSSTATSEVSVTFQRGPTAHLSMTGQGQFRTDGQTLALTAPKDGGAMVDLISTSTHGGGGITTYVWKSNGTPICSNSPNCSLPFRTASNTITLTVTDSDGQSSTATGQVNVTTKE